MDEGMPQIDREESSLLLQSNIRTQKIPRLSGILRQRQSLLDLLQIFITRVLIQQIQGAEETGGKFVRSGSHQTQKYIADRVLHRGAEGGGGGGEGEPRRVQGKDIARVHAHLQLPLPEDRTEGPLQPEGTCHLRKGEDHRLRLIALHLFKEEDPPPQLHEQTFLGERPQSQLPPPHR